MKQGHIYRIVHLQSDVQYVGSTFNEPRMRWQHHKQDFKKYLKGTHSTVAIYPFIEENGIEQFKLMLIKSYEVCDRKHLFAFEQLWINKLNCCNKQNPFCIRFVYDKAYRSKHKAVISERRKIYHIKNRESIAVKDKLRYEANKEKVLTRQKLFHEANKEHVNERRREKILCECGSEVSLGSMGKHKKTAKHQRLMAAVI
jgi:hypothetical protein